jgi:uncharacterized RDD family membrane protein YckC
VPRADDALLECGHERIAREGATGTRQVCGAGAIQLAEPAHARCAEPLWTPSSVLHQLVELSPSAASLANETMQVHEMEYEDRLTIATPEGVEMSLLLAGAASRFVSAIVDILIQSGILLAIAIVLGIAGSAGLGGGGLAVLLWAIISFLVVTSYDIFFEVLNSGRTPGKRLNGLRVVRVEGHPVGFLTSASRNTLRVIDFLPSAYLLGAAVILLSHKNQRIGDVVAGTIVVRERGGGVRDLPRLPPQQDLQPYAGWDTSQITAEEAATVRQFLERRDSIEPVARTELANTLAERLRPKITGVPANFSAEQFLEALAVAKGTRSWR